MFHDGINGPIYTHIQKGDGTGDSLDWVGLVRVGSTVYRWLGRPVMDWRGDCSGGNGW